jgi:DNA polymerase
VLDAGLQRAGAPREKLFITNAVKHFKHELHGKRRLHKTPDAGEVRACRWWLEAERRFVKPRVIVALGATAAMAVFGKPTPVLANRGRALELAPGKGLVTYHPSYLLRLPDEAAKKQAFAEFVSDLKLAWSLAET